TTLDSSKYSLAGQNLTFTTGNQPAAGATVRVAYWVGTNLTQFTASGLTVQVGNLATISADVIITKTDTQLTVGAANVNVQAGITDGTSFTGLSITGASFGLLITGSGYALVLNGGTDSLQGITGLSLSAGSLSLKANTT